MDLRIYRGGSWVERFILYPVSGDTHTAAVFAALSAAICLTVCVLAARLGR